MKQILLNCKYGKKAGICWGEGNEKKILALHGWLDNAASFYHLAPLLAKQGYEIIAIDFAGHGYSDHRAKGHFTHFIDYILDIQEVLNILKWQKPILLGHSMGGAMAQMYSAAYPEKVQKNIMIENIGPVPSYQTGEAAENLREALQQWQSHTPEPRHYHESFESALKARKKVTPMEERFLIPMVERGLKETEKGYHWRTDKRLRLRSLFRFPEEIIQDMLSAKKPPTLLILAKPYSYALNYPTVQKRIEKLNPDIYVELTGTHHLHMDKAEDVCNEILKFLTV